jgi:hypothetical protein
MCDAHLFCVETGNSASHSGARTVSKAPLPEPIAIDPHYSPQFYAELWGMSPSTIVRWFEDLDGVLRVGNSAGNGRRSRIELRIPFSLAMRVYEERTRRAVE